MLSNKIKVYLILSAIFLPNVAFACFDPIYSLWKWFSALVIIIFLLLLFLFAYFKIKKINPKKTSIFLILLLPIVLVNLIDLAIPTVDYLVHKKEYDKRERLIEKCIQDIKIKPTISSIDEAMSVITCRQKYNPGYELPTTGECSGANNLSSWVIDKIFNRGN